MIRRMKRLANSFVVLFVLAGSLSAASASDRVLTGTKQTTVVETSIFVALNRARTTRGLPALKRSFVLRGIASRHSRDMAGKGFFAHESRDGTGFSDRVRSRYASAGFSTWAVGENLLYSSGTLDGSAALRAWLGSAPHRKNILDPDWREVGIGVTYTYSGAGVFGGRPTWIVTMDFGARDAR